MKPNLTPQQRRAAFALARLLDRVPAERFDMSRWVAKDGMALTSYNTCDLLKHDCRTVACACGWATTLPSVRKLGAREPAFVGLFVFNIEGQRDRDYLFGPYRGVTAPTVAADIRAYLHDGTLPLST